MAASILYDGKISGAAIISAVAGNTTISSIPYANGMRVLIIKLAA